MALRLSRSRAGASLGLGRRSPGAHRPGLQTDRKIAQESIWKASEEEGSLGTVYSVKVNDRTWLEGRREIESFFIQEVDRDEVVLYGNP